MPGLKKDVEYPRRMVVYAIFDVLDRMKGKYKKTMAGDIKAEVTVKGNVGEYAFAVTEQSLDTSILHTTMLTTAADLSEAERALSIQYITERILKHIGEGQWPQTKRTGGM